MDDGQKRGRLFCIAGCNSTPALEMQEGILNQMAQLIEVFVIFALDLAVFSWRNHRLHSLSLGWSDNGVGIVASISQQVIGFYARNKVASFCAISDGSFCNNNSERHTMRIHGQVYFGVEPPFVRPIASSPPRAPVACRWTLA